MNLDGLIESEIETHHDRQAFDCGEPALNAYLQQHARQNSTRRSAKTYVLSQTSAPNQVIGYYSLAPGGIRFDQTPESIRRGLARHEVPVLRLVRLAVDLAYQGQGIGSQLMLRMSERCLAASNEIGGVAIMIDAKNERVAQWYQTFGAIPSPESSLVLFLPLRLVDEALRMSNWPEARRSQG